MRLALIILVTLLISFSANAQTPEPMPDIPLNREGGIYPMSCHTPLDTDLAQLCFVRVDIDPPLELGCMPATDPDADYTMDITVERTPHQNASIKCYMIDTTLNVGLESDNSGTVDFTPPGKPRVTQ